MNAPSVSVVLPFFNAELFLAEAIQSVLSQTYSDFQLLLVDDGSSDTSAEVARRYASRDRRVERVSHQDGRRLGPARARNVGIAQTSGLYVAFLDADDVWLPRKLERQLGMFAGHPDAAMVYGTSICWFSWSGGASSSRTDYVEQLGVSAGVVLPPPSLLRPFFVEQTAAVPNPSSILVRREAIERLGGFEEAVPSGYEDQAFCAKLCLHDALLASEEPLDRYRQHEHSLTKRIERNGEAATARAAFLGWLVGYLEQQGLDDPELLVELRRQRFRYLHPWLARMVSVGAR
jgi:glycosyltransferase involved in cell wall biosynthesis